MDSARAKTADSPVVEEPCRLPVTPAFFDWIIWQLADSAFPTGGFAHSLGLEAAWQQGEIGDSRELCQWLETTLTQISRGALPLINTTYLEPRRLCEVDHLTDAFLSNHVANRASRAQGRTFLAACRRIFKVGLDLDMNGAPCHLAPLFGALCRAINLPHATVTRLFLFINLRGGLAAAVRLNVVGPMEAQIIQTSLVERAEEIARTSQQFNLDDLAQTAPLLEIWQGAHDRLAGRLFQT